MFAPGLESLGWLAPGSNRMNTLASSFTAAMRMIHRIHGHTTNRGPDSHPAFPSGLSDLDIHVIFVTHCSYCGVTLLKYHPHFPGGEFKGNIVALFGSNQCALSRGTGHLAAFAKNEFDIMHIEAQRNIFQRQGITGFNRRIGTA